MIGRRVGIWAATVAVTLAVAAGSAFGEPDAAPAVAEGDAAQAEGKPARPETPRQWRPLDDGVFEAEVDAGGTLGTLRVTIVGGAVVAAHVDIGGGVMPLKAFAAPNATPITMVGRRENDSLRLRFDTFDPDRGAGTFEGTIQRGQVRGGFTLERR